MRGWHWDPAQPPCLCSGLVMVSLRRRLLQRDCPGEAGAGLGTLGTSGKGKCPELAAEPGPSVRGVATGKCFGFFLE